MARPIVTQELVFEIANTLFAAGEEPTIIKVQERIGGGSYTTVKRFLDEWNAYRKAQALQIAVPEDILQRGIEYVRLLWNAAIAQDDGRVAHVREEAQHQVAEARHALTAAEQIIEHLERDIEDLHKQVSDTQATIDSLRSVLHQAQIDKTAADTRAAQLDQQVTELRTELDQARQQRQSDISDMMEQIQQQLQEITMFTQRPPQPEQKEVGEN